MKRTARSTIGLSFLALATLSGCIPEIIDSAQDQPDLTSIDAGSYWVLETDSGLDLFQMPAARDDTGKWQSVTEVPDWYTQDGLYLHDSAGDWSLEAAGDETDLDALLQVWDPAA